MRRYLLLFLMVLSPVAAWAQPEPAVYVCAHPDDCLLFMSPNLYDDITQGGRVVVIYLTSGDAGEEFRKEGASYPYAREQASLEATDWMADVDKGPTPSRRKTAVVEIRGHRLERAGYAGTVSYFLRLPDGGMEGNGYVRYGNQSMRKLKGGEIERLTPVDGGDAYHGWQEFLGVLSGILEREMPGEEHVTFHVAEPDSGINHPDHSDHMTGAGGMLEALALPLSGGEAAERCHRVYRHIGYAIASLPANLDNTGLRNKAAGFAVLAAAQRRLLGYHHWDKAHLPYLAQNYYTVGAFPDGCR